MEKVEQLKWQANKLKELSKQSQFGRRSRIKQPTPSKLTKKSTTEPVGFNFKTNKRSKKSAKEIGGASSSTSTFPMNLRSSNVDLRNVRITFNPLFTEMFSFFVACIELVVTRLCEFKILYTGRTLMIFGLYLMMYPQSHLPLNV